MKTKYTRTRTGHQYRGGAVLITVLVMLILLTLLSLSSMSTNIMEERMAAASQEINRVFQASESGLELAFDDVNAFNLNNTEANPNTGTDNNFGSYSADISYSSAFSQETPPRRGSGWDSNYALYHFDISSTATTAIICRALLPRRSPQKINGGSAHNATRIKWRP